MWMLSYCYGHRRGLTTCLLNFTVIQSIYFLISGHHGAIDLWNNRDLIRCFEKKGKRVFKDNFCCMFALETISLPRKIIEQCRLCQYNVVHKWLFNIKKLTSFWRTRHAFVPFYIDWKYRSSYFHINRCNLLKDVSPFIDFWNVQYPLSNK